MKKLLVLVSVILAGLAITSCKPSYPASPTYKVVSRADLEAFIVVTNHLNVRKMLVLSDEAYAVPTIEWITKSYTPQLERFLFDNELRRPSDTENDCDKFAHYGVTVGHLMHHRATVKPKGTALAIGELSYIAWDLGGHAVNLFVATDNYGELKLVFYEPQARQIIELDPKSTYVLNLLL